MTADLSKVSSDELRAELERRKKLAQSRGRYPTMQAWAQAQLDGFQKTKAELKAQSGTGGDRERMRRRDQYLELDKQITKFTGLVAKYRKEGK